MDIEPVNASTTLYAPIQVNGTCSSGGCPQFRIDNITFGLHTQWAEANNGSQAGAMIRIDDSFGVMDHNTIPSGSNAELFVAALSSYLGVGAYGDNSWAQPLSLGGPNNVFAENNLGYTQYLAMNDCEAPGPNGCRVVLRYNQWNLTAGSAGFGLSQNHGTDTGGRFRGGVEMEVYNNTYSIPAGLVAAGTYGLRGGTGMFFNNTVAFGSNNSLDTSWLSMSLYRTVASFSPWGACGGSGGYDQNDGTVYFSGTMSTGGSGVLTMTDNSNTFGTLNPSGNPYSVYDVTHGFWAEVQSNTAHTITIWGPISESGWAGFNNGDSYQVLRAPYCIDQEGRGGPSTYLSGNTPSPTGWPSEALVPIYQWGDVSTGSAHVSNPSSMSDTVKVIANRDFYTQTVQQAAQTSAMSPFNGTSGTGWGTLAFRPTTCTANPVSGATGVAYWETDHSQLDYCISTNTWSTLASSPPSYTPYSYPHPLTTGTSGPPGNPPPSPPKAPTNLIATVD
jgi:hypothetical protein